MDDIIGVVILLIMVSLAAWYIIRAKKKGKTCIGCPYSGTCPGHCHTCSHDETEKRKDTLF